MATQYVLTRSNSSNTLVNVRFVPTSLANARIFAQSRADLEQRTVVLEYFNSDNGTGVVRETFAPAAALVSNGTDPLAAGSYIAVPPAGAIAAVTP